MAARIVARCPSTVSIHEQKDERPISDDELLSMVAHGNDDALGILLCRHHRFMVHVAFRWCHDSAMAEDIAQDAAVWVWQNAWRFSSGTSDSAKAWLATICKFRAFDALCKADRYRAISIETPLGDTDLTIGDTLSSGEPDAEASLLAEETQAALLQIIAALPHAQRTTILSWYFDELPDPARHEVLRRALANLQALLAGEAA